MLICALGTPRVKPTGMSQALARIRSGRGHVFRTESGYVMDNALRRMTTAGYDRCNGGGRCEVGARGRKRRAGLTTAARVSVDITRAD